MLDRTHLAIVRALDRHGSLTAAAEALHLTQPALSHAVRKLEDLLECELWQREGRHLRLTQAGQYLLGVANRVLPQLEQAEVLMRQYGQGRRGSLRIGMECHPCYQWLMKVVMPFLQDWPEVDIDVRQKFQFGGLGALLGHEIDMLVTPDPVQRPGLVYVPVFDYEQVLVVGLGHRLARQRKVRPEELQDEVLITYPVAPERLDIFTQFLLPHGVRPRQHKTIETTDIMLAMVAEGRGVTALPRWLAEEQRSQFGIRSLRLGDGGIAKQIFLGMRAEDEAIDYLRGFVELARMQG